MQSSSDRVWYIEYRGVGMRDEDQRGRWYLLSAHPSLEEAITALVKDRKARTTPGGATVAWNMQDARTIDQIRLRNPNTNEVIPEEIFND